MEWIEATKAFCGSGIDTLADSVRAKVRSVYDGILDGSCFNGQLEKAID